jgi:hypothetical protein
MAATVDIKFLPGLFTVILPYCGSRFGGIGRVSDKARPCYKGPDRNGKLLDRESNNLSSISKLRHASLRLRATAQGAFHELWCVTVTREGGIRSDHAGRTATACPGRFLSTHGGDPVTMALPPSLV